MRPAMLLVVAISVLLLGVPGSLHAINGIALDPSIGETDNEGDLPVTSLSWSHTIGGGSNRILLVGVAYSIASFTFVAGPSGTYGIASYKPTAAPNSIGSVKFGTSALSLLVGKSDSQQAFRVEAYYMFNPPTGTDNINVEFTTFQGLGVAYALGGSASLFNVMGLGEPASANDESGSNMQVTLSASSGDIVLDMLATQLGSDADPASPGQVKFFGWSQQFKQFVVSGSYQPALSPVTMSWTPTGDPLGTGWAQIAVVLKAQATPTPKVGPVGGFMQPVNKLAVFAPYLALFGVVATVAVVVVKTWKKREN